MKKQGAVYEIFFNSPSSLPRFSVCLHQSIATRAMFVRHTGHVGSLCIISKLHVWHTEAWRQGKNPITVVASKQTAQVQSVTKTLSLSCNTKFKAQVCMSIGNWKTKKKHVISWYVRIRSFGLTCCHEALSSHIQP